MAVFRDKTKRSKVKEKVIGGKADTTSEAGNTTVINVD